MFIQLGEEYHMEQLSEILHELGISKVKLAKFLGVSRQMIYNYLELDDINKWPKDKKVLLLNLLGVKTADEIEKIKIDTDYILNVENRLNSLVDNNKTDFGASTYSGLGKREKELLSNIISLLKDDLEESAAGSDEAYNVCKYLYHFLQAMENSEEAKYILGYVAKSAGFVKPLEYVFNEEEQFMFESFMFSAMTLYQNGNGVSKSKIAESHRRFVNQIEHKMEEKMSRTLELNAVKSQALKELGYTEINEKNAAEVFSKIAEIQSRSV